MLLVSVLLLAQMCLVSTISLSEAAEKGTGAGLAIVDSPDDLTNKHPYLWCRGYRPGSATHLAKGAGEIMIEEALDLINQVRP